MFPFASSEAKQAADGRTFWAHERRKLHEQSICSFPFTTTLDTAVYCSPCQFLFTCESVDQKNPELYLWVDRRSDWMECVWPRAAATAMKVIPIKVVVGGVPPSEE